METVPLAELDDVGLGEFHQTLLRTMFPPAELMTAQELLESVREGSAGGWLVVDAGQQVAGVVTEKYLDGRVGLLAYLAVRDGYRSHGLGAQLVRLVGDENDRLVLAEIEDPRFHSADPLKGDPAARLRFYARLGSRLLPLDYVQPSLDEGRVENLLLITVQSRFGDVAELDGTLVAAFLDEYFTACEGAAVLADPEYAALRRAATSARGGRLRLEPLERLTAARPDPPLHRMASRG